MYCLLAYNPPENSVSQIVFTGNNKKKMIIFYFFALAKGKYLHISFFFRTFAHDFVQAMI